MSRVGETGVGEMGIGETGVGEMGVGETGPNHFRHLAIFCDCTGRFESNLVETQIVGFLTHRRIYHSLDLPLTYFVMHKINSFSCICKLHIEIIIFIQLVAKIFSKVFLVCN